MLRCVGRLDDRLCLPLAYKSLPDPHDRYIVAAGGGNSGALWLWRPGEEKSFHQFDLPGVAYDIVVHPDGLKIAVVLYDNTVRVYVLLADPLASVVEQPAASE